MTPSSLLMMASLVIKLTDKERVQVSKEDSSIRDTFSQDINKRALWFFNWSTVNLLNVEMPTYNPRNFGARRG